MCANMFEEQCELAGLPTESLCWRCGQVSPEQMKEAMDEMLRSNGGEGVVSELELSDDSEDDPIGDATGDTMGAQKGAHGGGRGSPGRKVEKEKAVSKRSVEGVEGEESEEGKRMDEKSGKDEERKKDEEDAKGEDSEEDAKGEDDETSEKSGDSDEDGEDDDSDDSGDETEKGSSGEDEHLFGEGNLFSAGKGVEPPVSSVPTARTTTTPQGPTELPPGGLFSPRPPTSDTTADSAGADARTPKSQQSSTKKRDSPPNLRSRRDTSSTWACVAPGARLMLKRTAATPAERCTLVWKAAEPQNMMSVTFDAPGNARVHTTPAWVDNFNGPPSKLIPEADDVEPLHRAVYSVLAPG